MMRGMDIDICPYQEVLREKFMTTNEWTKLNDRYQSILFPEMIKNFNITDEKLTLLTAYPYVDNYYSAWFDQMEITNELDDEAKDGIEQILRDGLYEGFYGFDLAIRLATSRFFNFLRTTLQWKVDAIEGVENTPKFYNDIKYMYLSAHDSSLTAFMSGFQQKQKVQAYFASNIVVMLKVSEYIVISSVGNN